MGRVKGRRRAPPPSPAGNGDVVCSANERCSSCPGDCGVCPPFCGDGRCDDHEDVQSCRTDCEVPCTGGTVDCCGDGVCLPRTVCGHINC